MPDELIQQVEDEARQRRLLDLGESMVKGYLYFASALSYILGLVFGIVFLARCKYQENRKLGTVCIILAVVNIVFIGLCVAAYIVVIAAAIFGLAASTTGAGAAGGG